MQVAEYPGNRLEMAEAMENTKSEFISLEAWRATFAEFIATLLFVFLGAGAVVVSGTLTNGELTAARLVTIALAHGLAIALLVFATAHISGGHINPAVTFAALLTKKIGAAKGLMFIVAQVVGALVGTLLRWKAFGIEPFMARGSYERLRE